MSIILKSSLAIAATALGLSAMASSVSAATVTFDFTSGDNGGFTTSGSPIWSYTGTQWQTNEANSSTSFLTSPLFTVETNGDVNISLNHLYDFERPRTFYDGGLLQASINGGTFAIITPNGGYPNAAVCTLLGNIPCWSGNSGGSVTDTATLAGLSAGDTFQFRFQSAWDSSILYPNPNWGITRVSIDLLNAVPAVPEPSTIVALAMVGGGLLLRKGMKRG